MLPNEDSYHLSTSKLQDRLLQEILYRRRRHTILRLTALGLLLFGQFVALYLVTNKALDEETRALLLAILPILTAIMGFSLGRNFDYSTDKLEKYKIENEFIVLDELSRKEQDLMVLRDELSKSRRSKR